MKVYIVSTAQSDDDGNLSTTINGVYTDKNKAIARVKEVHDDIVDYYNDPDDDYEDGDLFFDISEADDIAIRQVVTIDEKEVE